ncbi:NusG domain II-containing protein [Terrisporobacter sp.]
MQIIFVIGGSKLKKKDFILIFFVVLIIAGAFGINYFFNTKNVNAIEIYVDNKLYKTYDIKDEEEIKIKSKKGYNIVKIHGGGAEMIDASCPDKICIKEGIITKSNESIVCLPNKVHIKITTQDNHNNEEDVISK